MAGVWYLATITAVSVLMVFCAANAPPVYVAMLVGAVLIFGALFFDSDRSE